MQIEIFSDVVCPWCFIGKHRLDAALATAAGEGVTVRWRPFMLHPRLPAAGMARRDWLTTRYGDRADAARVPQAIAREGAEVGITFDYAAIERMPQTLDAHRLLDYAAPHGVQHELAETLFRAYFCDGRDLGDRDELTRAGAAHGLDAAPLRAWLDSDAGVEDVHAQLSRAVDLGIAGVPNYLLGGVFPIPGAQSAEVFAQFISRARSKLPA